jgi:hypothetical protein
MPIRCSLGWKETSKSRLDDGEMKDTSLITK